MTKQPQFQRSADARFLIQKLKALAIGEQISYAALADAIGKTIADLPGPLYTARRVLLREDNMVFDAIRGEGLKRLSDHEIVGTAASTTKRLRRTARRGLQTLTAVADFSGLVREDQMRHSASMSILGAVAEMTTERALTKIETKVSEHREALPFAQTLEAFRK